MILKPIYINASYLTLKSNYIAVMVKLAFSMRVHGTEADNNEINFCEYLMYAIDTTRGRVSYRGL